MPFGRAKVYLPNFVITLLRTPHLPPTQAQFIVPLSFTKLDLKDYLFHVYSVQTLSIRSLVKETNRTPRNVRAKSLDLNKRNVKVMTVELERPFVWPAEEKDLSRWDKDLYDSAKEFEEKRRDHIQARGTKPEPGRREMLEGLVKEVQGEGPAGGEKAEV